MATTAPTGAAPAPPRVQPAALLGLCTGSALLNAAMATASAAAGLVAASHLGLGWAGLPGTAAVAGTAAGAVLLTAVMVRVGRRAGLLLGYATATVCAGVSLVAVVTGRVSILTAGMLLLGVGNAGGQLARYAAADLFPAERRGAAISWVVGAATVGAVGGPLLIAPVGQFSDSLGWTALAGPFLLATGVCGAATVSASTAPRAVLAAPASLRPRQLIGTTQARAPLAVMVGAQVVMVAVMTATPLEMHEHGGGLGSIGAVVSAHTLGMFVLSPLTGRQVERHGARPLMALGLLATAAATAMASVTADGPGRTTALFLLGCGWNLCFIGGSSALAAGLPDGQRFAVEGAVDSAVWSLSAVASLLSPVLLTVGGFAVLNGTAATLLLVPAALRSPAPGRSTDGGPTDGGMAQGRGRRPGLRGEGQAPVPDGHEQDPCDAASRRLAADQRHRARVHRRTGHARDDGRVHEAPGRAPRPARRRPQPHGRGRHRRPRLARRRQVRRQARRGRTPKDNDYPGAGFFRVDLAEVTLTYVGVPADHLVIESWDARRGWERRTRK